MFTGQRPILGLEVAVPVEIAEFNDVGLAHARQRVKMTHC
jgi:hypothetical protein